MLRTLINSSCLCSLLIAVFLVSSSIGQRRPFPVPPEPAAPGAPSSSDPKSSFHRVDALTMEREAKEMAALAATIPGDVDLLKKGLLPRDAVDKLKRIEKLSKQLRGQIQP